jgi:hypothetical protein
MRAYYVDKTFMNFMRMNYLIKNLCSNERERQRVEYGFSYNKYILIFMNLIKKMLFDKINLRCCVLSKKMLLSQIYHTKHQ